MNSRKMFVSVFVGLFVSLFIARAVVAQTEKLGLVQYTPPQGWVKSAKEHAVVFSDVNQAAGRFCFITLYSAGSSTGDPKSDFAREWNVRVVQPWGTAADPKTETVPDNGWTVVAAGAPIDFSGNKAFAFLTVVSGFGKTVTVLGVLNDDSYLAPLQAFVGKLDIDKTNTPAVDTAPTAKPALQYDDYGHLIIPPPARQLTLADLAGQWGESEGINVRYVDRYSGTYAGADSLHYKIKMTFTAAGGYYDDFYAIQNGKMIKEKAAGSVAVNGRVLVIKDTNLRKYVIRGWLELTNMTIMEVCGPWYNDDVIPDEIFTNPAQGANLNKKWARTK
ncbi:MAG TPA: hypothetical protein VGP08_15140 [Pyrinomonadaceae bacterium]|jgi:hypothetical protein|nr:hypothetical protein [Pyrinomonadaceae bacterium]